MTSVVFIPSVQKDKRAVSWPIRSLQPTKDANASPPLVSYESAPVKGILWGLALSSLFWISLGLVIAYFGG